MPQLKRMLAWIAGFVERHLRLLLIGVGLLIVTRVFAVGCYAVRMPSMMPTLEGGPPASDRILVDKLSHRFWPLERFDVLVFWSPEDLKSYIKRLVALPGEHLQLSRGDLVIDGEIVRKTLDQILEMRVGVHRWEDGDSLAGPWVRAGQGWEPKDAHASAIPRAGQVALFEYQHAVRDIYFDLDGSERKDRPVSPEVVSDLILTVETEASGSGSLLLVLEECADRFELEIPLDPGELFLRRNGEILAERPVPAGWSGRHRVLFANVDDRLTVALDDGPVLLAVDYVQPPPVDAPSNGVSLAVRGGDDLPARVSFLDLRLDRDIHYRRSSSGRHPMPGRPNFLVPPNGYFLLGDNCPESRDSRDFGNVFQEDLIGRAFAIYWPWSRRRSL